MRKKPGRRPPLMLPEEFLHNIRFFDGGEEWLEELSDHLEACEERFGITLHAPYELSFNYVTPASRADGTRVVFKTGVPNPELYTEIAALRIYDGDGITRLLDADEGLGAFLVEHLHPGTPLTEVAHEDDDEATRIAALVMQQLWKPVPPRHKFPTTENWCMSMLPEMRDMFDEVKDPYPPVLVDKAQGIFDDFFAAQGEQVLLHGDLHHWNILRAERAPWLALDPKGVIGEREYEVGALLRNPWGWIFKQAAIKPILLRRLDILVEMLGFDRQRLLGWTFAQAVLSSWWGYDPGAPERDWRPVLRVAEALIDEF